MSKTEPLCLSLLNICKNLTTFKQIHANVLKLGLESDPFIAGKLLHHCAISLSDSMDYACRLFRYTPNPDVFMHNTLIRGLYESDRPQNSLRVFIEMMRKSFSPPDSFTFAFIVKAAANLRSVRVGIQLHCQALVHGLDTHLFVGTTLISMYGECGFVKFARKVFDEMLEPNAIAWNAMVTACCRGGDMKGGRELFDLMPVRNLMSWNVMLAGYTKAGELELAREMFLEMPMKDDVSWSTMIVGFAHNGYFQEAFIFFRELRRKGMRPNETSLTGVLSSCAQAGALEFGKILHGFIEKSGLAWIVSVNNALLDTYSKCTKQYNITEEAYKKLKEIIGRLRVEGGYVPEIGRVLHDIEEEEKEGSVSVHSEKLAVAFGIARLCKGRTIRIVKNLRICRDCHAVMKLISQIYKVEIVVRDRSRFHSFKDGYCSCRDYW
ncbi:hypothetical protein OIU79_018515 [Salix purpurea]|uniref:DYW domain-containing protein n=1 Tax=Salix purpurea TaxID=77065 RepID=A0A9Q0WXJ1_SALPP|nr:hypothetical protein OIU79_018515 [Salix purpurea]